MRFAFVAFLLGVVACGDFSNSPIVGPDGRSWYRIECRHRDKCPTLAQDRCPDGYVKGDDTDKQAFDETGKPKARHDDRRVMMIRCVSKDEQK